MKYFFICGDPSGDRLSAPIAERLIVDHDATIQALGGNQLRQAGVDIVEDYTPLNIMGWSQVITNLPKIISIIQRLKGKITSFSPDTIVLVDSAGINLKMAKWCHKKGYPVVYFIPPKVWASRESRLSKIKTYCNLLIVLYPFEKAYFKNKGLDVIFAGNPLVSLQDRYKPSSSFREKYDLNNNHIISILPGSRAQEIKRILPPMLDAVASFKEINICISCAPTIDESLLLSLLNREQKDRVHIINGNPYELLANSHLCIVTSGTATIECAILKIPMIVCYKTSSLNYEIAKRLISTQFIALPNLILNRRAVPELIQKECNSTTIAKHVSSLLKKAGRSLQIESFEEIYEQLNRDQTIKSIACAISHNGKKFN